MRMDVRRLPRQIILGTLDGARKRGQGGKDKEWVDCVERGVRAFGILADLGTLDDARKRERGG